MSFKNILILASLAVATIAVPSARVACGAGRVTSNAAVRIFLHDPYNVSWHSTCVNSAVNGSTSWMIFRRICEYPCEMSLVIALIIERRFDGAECGEEAHEVSKPPTFCVFVVSHAIHCTVAPGNAYLSYEMIMLNLLYS